MKSGFKIVPYQKSKAAIISLALVYWFAIFQGSAKTNVSPQWIHIYDMIFIVMRCVQRGTDPLQSAADSWFERRKKVHVCGEVRRKSGQQFGDARVSYIIVISSISNSNVLYISNACYL